MHELEDGAAFNQIRLNLFQVGWVSQKSSEWVHSGVESPFNRIYFVVKGDPVVTRDDPKIGGGKAVSLLPGKVYLIPLNRRFSYACEKRVEKLYAHFRLETSLGRDLFEDVQEVLELGSFDTKTVNKMRPSEEKGNLERVLFLKSILYQFLSRAAFPDVTGFQRDRELRKRYETVLRKMEEGLSARLTVENLARLQGRSLASFSGDFRRDFGRTAKSFLNRRLTARAMDLLTQSDRKIRDVARELGFDDEYYFSRFFKKMTGRSPLDYRKMSRMG